MSGFEAFDVSPHIQCLGAVSFIHSTHYMYACLCAPMNAFDVVYSIPFALALSRPLALFCSDTHSRSSTHAMDKSTYYSLSKVYFAVPNLLLHFLKAL